MFLVKDVDWLHGIRFYKFPWQSGERLHERGTWKFRSNLVTSGDDLMKGKPVDFLWIWRCRFISYVFTIYNIYIYIYYSINCLVTHNFHYLLGDLGLDFDPGGIASIDGSGVSRLRRLRMYTLVEFANWGFDMVWEKTTNATTYHSLIRWFLVFLTYYVLIHWSS